MDSIDILAKPNNDVNHFISVLQIHKTDDTKIFKARDNRNVALHYDRILFCFDLEATDGNNVFAMLIGRNQNASIFSGSFDQRDTRTFGKYITCIILSTVYILTRSALLNIFIAAPGKQFVIVNPSTVKTFMGENGAIPLLNTAQPIHSVKTDVLPVQRYPIEAQGNMHAFKLRGVKIQLNNLQVGSVSCGGNMCDALMMHENGIAQDKCACYTICEREAKICLVFDLKILYKRKDGGRSHFMVSNHTSKQFTRLFMVGFKIPVGVIPDNITSNEAAREALQMSVLDILELGNNSGGWNISGWTKRGLIVDAGAGAEPSTSSYKPSSRQVVEAGKLGYHITSIEFRNSPLIETLQEYQFDPVSLLRLVLDHGSVI